MPLFSWSFRRSRAVECPPGSTNRPSSTPKNAPSTPKLTTTSTTIKSRSEVNEVKAAKRISRGHRAATLATGTAPFLELDLGDPVMTSSWWKDSWDSQRVEFLISRHKHQTSQSSIPKIPSGTPRPESPQLKPSSFGSSSECTMNDVTPFAPAPPLAGSKLKKVQSVNDLPALAPVFFDALPSFSASPAAIVMLDPALPVVEKTLRPAPRPRIKEGLDTKPSEERRARSRRPATANADLRARQDERLQRWPSSSEAGSSSIASSVHGLAVGPGACIPGEQLSGRNGLLFDRSARAMTMSIDPRCEVADEDVKEHVRDGSCSPPPEIFPLTSRRSWHLPTTATTSMTSTLHSDTLVTDGPDIVEPTPSSDKVTEATKVEPESCATRRIVSLRQHRTSKRPGRFRRVPRAETPPSQGAIEQLAESETTTMLTSQEPRRLRVMTGPSSRAAPLDLGIPINTSTVGYGPSPMPLPERACSIDEARSLRSIRSVASSQLLGDSKRRLIISPIPNKGDANVPAPPPLGPALSSTHQRSIEERFARSPRTVPRSLLCEERQAYSAGHGYDGDSRAATSRSGSCSTQASSSRLEANVTSSLTRKQASHQITTANGELLYYCRFTRSFTGTSLALSMPWLPLALSGRLTIWRADGTPLYVISASRSKRFTFNIRPCSGNGGGWAKSPITPKTPTGTRGRKGAASLGGSSTLRVAKADYFGQRWRWQAPFMTTTMGSTMIDAGKVEGSTMKEGPAIPASPDHVLEWEGTHVIKLVDKGRASSSGVIPTARERAIACYIRDVRAVEGGGELLIDDKSPDVDHIVATLLIVQQWHLNSIGAAEERA